MPKFELTLVHRLDNGVAQSVNKIQADTLISLVTQLLPVIAEVEHEHRELEIVKMHEDNDDFPF